jgi:hypothetical protein
MHPHQQPDLRQTRAILASLAAIVKSAIEVRGESLGLDGR